MPLQPGRVEAVEPGHVRIGIRADGRAACAGRRPASANASSAADLGGRDRPAAQPRIARQQVLDDRRRLPPARASRCSRPAARPAWSARPRARAGGAAAPRASAMSASRLSQGMSGWRRMVPVDEQGASSSTASNGPACHSRRVGGDGLGRKAEPREVLPQPRRAAASVRSTATTLAPAAASCAVLPPGAAQRSATVLPRTSPSSRAGSAAAASCTHQAPSA